MSSLSALAKTVLAPYAKNGNTGNCYEIFFALDVLRSMGLMDADLDGLAGLLGQIKAANQRTADKIDVALAQIRSRATGAGCVVAGQTVVGLRNVTQDDNDGGTGDIVLCLASGRELAVSIFAGKVKRDGAIEKCLSNPTCSRYGCTEDDLVAFKGIAAAAVPAYKKEMTDKYGADEAAWNRKPSSAAVKACSAVAAATAARFNALPAAERVARFQDLTRCSNGGKPADMLCVVNPNCKKYALFNIIKSNIDGGAVSVRADQFWLYMTVNGQEVGKTQVKFNNGVYHKGKTSSIISSWNASCYMNKVFTLESTMI